MSDSKPARILAATIVAVVIPLGLFARSYRRGADANTALGFVATYAGDTLWPVMFYFIGRFCWPSARIRSLLLATLALTLSIEFLQLWQPPWLQWLRAQPVIGFLLGQTFIRSDAARCTLGAFAAACADFVLRKNTVRSS